MLFHLVPKYYTSKIRQMPMIDKFGGIFVDALLNPINFKLKKVHHIRYQTVVHIYIFDLLGKYFLSFRFHWSIVY